MPGLQSFSELQKDQLSVVEEHLLKTLEYDSMVSVGDFSSIENKRTWELLQDYMSDKYLSKEQIVRLLKKLDETITRIRNVLIGNEEVYHYYFKSYYDLPQATFSIIARHLQYYHDAEMTDRLRTIIANFDNALQHINHGEHTHSTLLWHIFVMFSSELLIKRTFFDIMIAYLQSKIEEHSILVSNVCANVLKYLEDLMDHSEAEWNALMRLVQKLSFMEKTENMVWLLLNMVGRAFSTEQPCFQQKMQAFLSQHGDEIFTSVIDKLVELQKSDKAVVYDYGYLLFLLALFMNSEAGAGCFRQPTRHYLHSYAMAEFNKITETGLYRTVYETFWPAAIIFTAELADAGKVFVGLCRKKIKLNSRKRYLSESVVNIVFHPDAIYDIFKNRPWSMYLPFERIAEYKEAIAATIISEQLINDKCLYEASRSLLRRTIGV